MKMWTFDEGILLDENDEAIACTWECEAATERNIRLMTSAPEMYEWLKAVIESHDNSKIINVKHIKELLAQIDGKKNEEAKHDYY